jgi:hypothetical protein
VFVCGEFLQANKLIADNKISHRAGEYFDIKNCLVKEKLSVQDKHFKQVQLIKLLVFFASWTAGEMQG